MIASDLALALDPARLAEALGFELDDWQARLLRSDSRQILMNCARQTGKSTLAAILALHEALYRAPALVLVLSPSLRQSSELFKKVKHFYTLLGETAPAATKETELTLELAGGGRIVSLPGRATTIRGYSAVDLLVIDEAARVEDGLYHAVRPMLAISGGRLIALSTPFGKRGFFFNEWTDGEGWHRVKVTAEKCPRIDGDWLERERRQIGKWWFQQEYMCEFMEPVDSVFDYSLIDAAISAEVKPLFESVNHDAIDDGISVLFGA